MKEDTEVWIFYSKKTEPKVLDSYNEGIIYLKNSEVDLNILP